MNTTRRSTRRKDNYHFVGPYERQIPAESGIESRLVAQERKAISAKDLQIRRIDGETGVAEWHTLHEWNQINGYEALEGEIVLPEFPSEQVNKDFDDFAKAAIAVINKIIPAQTPSTHSRLTPCFRCGEVYVPGMLHRCK